MATHRAPASEALSLLLSVNIAQDKEACRTNLERLGGVTALDHLISRELTSEANISCATILDGGLTNEQVILSQQRFGVNKFPNSKTNSFLHLLLAALSDSTLIILMMAATVSLIIGLIENPSDGWEEGTAIYIAVTLCSLIAATNDYTKQLQFQALEQSVADDEQSSVLRAGVIERIHARDIVVGDTLVLQSGDMIPADCILVDDSEVLCSESNLTGESSEVLKSRSGDCFLLSSCIITGLPKTVHAGRCTGLAIAVGMQSQWGKIKASLMTETVNTPLQDKLQDMTAKIGYVGFVTAICTFIALLANIWVKDSGLSYLTALVDAFIIAVTVVVVAIPEGLPLAVNISLAYSTKKMYNDKCLIRVLAACETMGNATCICTDKTGTLTENRMTVVDAWAADIFITQSELPVAPSILPSNLLESIAEQVAVNRTAYLVFKNADGRLLHQPAVVGSKTEGALIMMLRSWGIDCEVIQSTIFSARTDKVFAFSSVKKRSSAVVFRSRRNTAMLLNMDVSPQTISDSLETSNLVAQDTIARLYCKGASESVLKDCTMYVSGSGQIKAIDNVTRQRLEQVLESFADKALRTLCLAHKDFTARNPLPENWINQPPDDSELVLEMIVGITDPLRLDVTEAIKVAQDAGLVVRMVTGDSSATACTIARQCGILGPRIGSGRDDRQVVEGKQLRVMSPHELDELLPTLRVVARSSPTDKLLLVQRLNGFNLPRNQQEWESMHNSASTGSKDSDITWENQKDQLLPGYRREWESTRPGGGEVVGVTGDGTNDAPALKAADVGLSMGLTGTKVAQGASDIVILDDNFTSIVRAISWGRAVYDNIRKFLQFQLTVNFVALITVFISAVCGKEMPLNAVQLLWVNLVMDTLGALALGTELPTPEVLLRKPYKRNASLISRPMMRNILCQTALQLSALLTLLYCGASFFNVNEHVVCGVYAVNREYTAKWDPLTREIVPSDYSTAFGTVGCADFTRYCESQGYECLHTARWLPVYNQTETEPNKVWESLSSLDKFEARCLRCEVTDYTLTTIVFNAFIFLQIFNEYSSRILDNELNMFKGIGKNLALPFVTVITAGIQAVLVQFGGDFVRTSPLTRWQWIITILIGALSIPMGWLMRLLIPVEEDPSTFFSHKESNPSASFNQGFEAEDELIESPLQRDLSHARGQKKGGSSLKSPPMEDSNSKRQNFSYQSLGSAIGKDTTIGLFSP